MDSVIIKYNETFDKVRGTSSKPYFITEKQSFSVIMKQNI